MDRRHLAFENVIPLEICEHIYEFFNRRLDLHVHKANNPNVIKINAPWSHFGQILEPILSPYFKTIKGQGGNVYKHSNLYTTHVDSHELYQMINCLIPIHVTSSNIMQHFVVFDQWVDNGIGRTWYGDRPDITSRSDFDVNKKVALTPFEDDSVYNKTDTDIDLNFYNNYLDFPKHKHEYFKGLTGTAYEFRPGNLLLFNSNQLHSTGKLVGDWKMGLHINFEGSLEELLI